MSRRNGHHFGIFSPSANALDSELFSLIPTQQQPFVRQGGLRKKQLIMLNFNLDAIKPEFCCEILEEIMDAPVIDPTTLNPKAKAWVLASDLEKQTLDSGNFYDVSRFDRLTLERAVKDAKGKSPMTRQSLDPEEFIEDKKLNAEIATFLKNIVDAHREKLQLKKISDKEELCSILMNRIYWCQPDKVLKVILDGADVNKIYKKNFTPYEFIYDIPGLESPLFFAVKIAAQLLHPCMNQKRASLRREDALEVIHILIDFGADLSVKDVFRVSLTEMALRMGDPVVAEILVKAGAPRETELSTRRIGQALYVVPRM